MGFVGHQAIADYFQSQAERARKPDRKAHYQRCADEYRVRAGQAGKTGLAQDGKERPEPSRHPAAT